MNMQKMMKQMQKMQSDMAKVQEALTSQYIQSTSGGGAVCVTINGHQEIQEIKLNPDVVDKEDVEMLQDLMVAAINEAIRQSKDLAASEMQKVTGGINLPNIPGLM